MVNDLITYITLVLIQALLLFSNISLAFLILITHTSSVYEKIVLLPFRAIIF